MLAWVARRGHGNPCCQGDKSGGEESMAGKKAGSVVLTWRVPVELPVRY
jgi:hypothetical protein